MRQNIDEKWKCDPRRRALVKRLGSERLADGMRVEINWLILDHRGQPIPLKEFQFVENHQDWIDCGLAELKGGVVRIAGADAYFDFFEKQKTNAAKGGKAKAAKRKPKLPRATQTQPGCPSSSISFSSSNSSSGSSSISDSSSNSQDENSSNSKPQAFIGIYCRAFKERWGINPPIQGKDTGIVKRLAAVLSEDQFEKLIHNYLQMPDAWLVKNKHPLNLFETKLNEIVVFADSGKFTTNREVRQADDMATTTKMLRDVREGKL